MMFYIVISQRSEVRSGFSLIQNEILLLVGRAAVDTRLQFRAQFYQPTADTEAALWSTSTFDWLTYIWAVKFEEVNWDLMFFSLF